MSRKAQPRLLHPLWQDESGDSDISITSTAPSEPRSEYTVDDILLEDERSDGVYYLVKWKDYDLHRATWEPAENLNDDLLHQWEERKRQIASGFRVPFDIRTWESAVAAAERAKKLRKAKRKEKRQELARNKKALERTTKAQTTKAQPTKAQTTKFQPTKAQPTSIVQAARNEPSDEDDIPLLHTLRKKKKKIRESDASSFEPDEDVTLAQAKQSKAKVSVQRSKTAMMEAAETSRLSTSTTARARGNGTKESKVKSRPAQPTAISTNISRGPSAQSSSDSDTPLMLSSY
ncbi:hypothetical protein EJ06DRAFT_552601 [Trichodelitschia bisporula]|uniref:Chromo domain-containing protein n=1 Tax=Trichodelitschia bisporula TaxID=703511 RepID=A0A6G1IA71_9PEZI|nr:hypothetical protein EJ06DRAFT_552601 [Trichodelitschia bisporula]